MEITNNKITKEQAKVILLSSMGGLLEYFDFVIYGFFAHIIGEVFFKSSSLIINEIEGYSIFAIGYLARPIGGFIFSHFGDTQSRKKTFLVTIFLMAFSTLTIGFIPTYAQIGYFAPVVLILLRLIQGFAVGGELPGSITFVFEHVSKNRQGLACGILYSGVIGGIVLGSITSTVIFKNFSHDTIIQWGWRIPFIVGGTLGIIGNILRKNLAESPIFKKIYLTKETHKYPVIELFKKHKITLASGVFITAFSAVVTSLCFYIPGYLHINYGYNESKILFINTISIVFQCFSIVITGIICDKIPRKSMALITCYLFFFLTPVIFYIIGRANTNVLWATMIFLGVISGCIVGCLGSLLAEIFPAPIRFSGIAGSLNIAVALFAGPAPLIFDLLMKHFHNNLLPAFFVSFFALIAFFFVRNLPDISQKKSQNISSQPDVCSSSP